MQISDLYRNRPFGLSIEIFPPKTVKGDSSLLKNLERLAAFAPGFISCTYGAGGSTRDRTIEWCQTIQDRFERTATAHLTCVGSTREELTAWIERARAAKIRNIMALRGDTPVGLDSFEVPEGGLYHAIELVELIRSLFGDMGIGVAGYPEKHPEAPDAATDLANLQRKVDAGADAVFTQLFFVNDNFLEFRDRCVTAGIDVPIVPGIMPITEFSRIKRVTSMCGAMISPDLASRLETAQDDRKTQFEIGVNHAIQQCRELIRAGVPGIHFYVLNQSQACERVLASLDFDPGHRECA